MKLFLQGLWAVAFGLGYVQALTSLRTMITPTTPTTMPRRTITKTIKHHKHTATTTTTKSCPPDPSSTHTLPHLKPCENGVQTFAIQARGCNDPYDGLYVGTRFRSLDANFLVTNPSEHGSTDTPTLFYLDNQGTLRAVPETTANATSIGNAEVVFLCDMIDPGGYAGTFVFNTTAAWTYNQDPNFFYYTFSPLVCNIEASSGQLLCYEVYCRHNVLFGLTKLELDGVIGLWNGMGPDTGGINTALRNATYYAVPGCTMG